jgi:hypothetical protein
MGLYLVFNADLRYLIQKKAKTKINTKPDTNRRSFLIKTATNSAHAVGFDVARAHLFIYLNTTYFEWSFVRVVDMIL